MTYPTLSFLKRLGVVFAVSLALASAAFAESATAPRKSYNVAAGDAALTLKTFSEQSGEQIVYPVDKVRGLQTKAVRGDLTAREALTQMLAGSASLKSISGPFSIAQYANASADMGPAWFLYFLGIVSLGLAVMNLLPIPILDGGHLLYYLIELVKGSPVSERAQMAGQYVGLMLLVALMGLAFYNDILRIAS